MMSLRKGNGEEGNDINWNSGEERTEGCVAFKKRNH